MLMIRSVTRLLASLASSAGRAVSGLGRAVVSLGGGIGASFALLRGRWRLFRRDLDGAVQSLDAATRRAPDAFSPWLHLARAHLKNRNWVGARRALARARDLSPDRFDAVAVRTLKHDGFEIAVLADPVPAAAVPAAQGPAVAQVERTAVRARAREGSSSHPLGDCRDLDEYARFRSMPPITAAEIESVDWDVVADDLLDG
jgi:hypothetical protein